MGEIRRPSWVAAPSRELAAPGDTFEWYAQTCTGCHSRTMIYAGRFGAEYETTLCVVCQKRRRGQPRPYWYVQTAADLPGLGEPLSEWEARKKADPGVFE
jgi:hypothetical protein